MSKPITPIFRVSYPNVFEPKADMQGNPKYSLVALFDKGQDLSVLQELIDGALEKEFGPEKSKWPKKYKSPIKDQGDRIEAAEDNGKPAPSGYVKGAKYLDLKSKDRPGVVGPDTAPIAEPQDFYPGCYARAYVSAYWYNVNGNKGVTFGLQHVQKVKDGERLGGRVAVESAFQAIESDDSIDDMFDGEQA